MQKFSFWAGILVLILGVVGILFFMVRTSMDLASTGGPALRTQVTSEDWVRTTATSSVPRATLVEYADFQCPACASYHPVLKQLETDHPELQVVFRHFPLAQHVQAKPAAVAAEAAGKQGKFWEMHDMLFEKQTEWGTASDAAKLFRGYAESLGLDPVRFDADTQDPALLAKVEAGAIDGVANGVNSTPTFFLNGTRMVNPRSYDAFKQAVKAAIAETPAQ